MKFVIVLVSALALAAGYRLQNVETKKCVRDLHSGVEPTHYNVEEQCSFFSTDFKDGNGAANGQVRVTSAMSFSRSRKCIQGDNDDWQNEPTLFVSGYKCDNNQIKPEYFQWSFSDVGGQKYMITHVKSGMCLTPQLDGGQYLQMSKNCSSTDNLALWTKA